ncbi:MAG: hypothetical protein H7210_03185 [Pyrinomonadaceae bacterium]|nr:hypothetical protein [Phycisphaerales bacterium]
MGSNIPVIIVTGSISEEVAVECMKLGASDYLLKDRMARLGKAVKQALAAKRVGDEKRRAEKTRDAAMSELDHRVRNNLASVLALLDMSSRSSQADERFATILRGRIGAIAWAHDALRDRQWIGADLASLINRNLTKIQDQAGGQLTMEGGSLQLPSQAVNSVSLAVHELAVNAAAFGAWSVPGGLVEIKWKMLPEDRIALTWQESNGPPVRPPTHRGLGLHLIENLMTHETGGNVLLTFAPTGFRAEFTLPAVDRPSRIP